MGEIEEVRSRFIKTMQGLHALSRFESRVAEYLHRLDLHELYVYVAAHPTCIKENMLLRQRGLR